MLHITPIYACVLALIFIYLTFCVIGFRRGNQIGLGDGGDKTLLRRIRAHSNFAEYAPFALILMAFAELAGAPGWQLHIIGTLLVLGRLLHAIGFGREPETMNLRVAGMLMTIFALLTGVIFNLLASFT